MRVETIGDATLYLGDCMDILPTLDRVDVVITDPPYGIYACGGKWGRKADLQWDREAPHIDALLSFGEMQIIWGGNYFPLPPSRGWLVWHKPDSVPSAASVELAWTSVDMNSRWISQSIAATNAERAGHPTQKPLRVMLWTMGFVPDGLTHVLDPFMGSGTTGVAAIQTGRKFIGIEREPKYFDIACRRIEQAVSQGQLFSHEAPKPKQLALEADSLAGADSTMGEQP